MTILAITWCSNSCCYSTYIKVEMKAQQRRKYNKAIFIYRCLNIQQEGLHPNYLRHSEIHCYDAKNKDRFLLPKPRPEYMKHIFKYITLWNSLPKNVQSSDSASSFKRQLIKYYCSHLITLFYFIVMMSSYFVFILILSMYILYIYLNIVLIYVKDTWENRLLKMCHD